MMIVGFINSLFFIEVSSTIISHYEILKIAKQILQNHINGQ